MERKQRKGTGGGILRPAQTRRGTGRRRLAVLLAVCLTFTLTPDMAPKAAGGVKSAQRVGRISGSSAGHPRAVTSS